MTPIEHTGKSVQGSPRRVDSTQPVIGQQPLEGSGGGHVIGQADRARPVQATPVMRPEVMRLPVQGPVEVHSKVEEPVAPLEAVSRLGKPIYSTPAERAVLETVVAANDDTLQPRVVSNAEFESLQEEGFIVAYPQEGGSVLHLPEEFSPHHAVAVARAIDGDTHSGYRGRAQPEYELQMSGMTMLGLGRYIHDRLEGIGKGRELARVTAESLLDNGVRINTGEEPNSWIAKAVMAARFPVPREHAALDEEARTAALDRFFSYAQAARESGDPVKQKVVDRVAKHFLGDVKPQVAVEKALFQRGAHRLLTQSPLEGWKEHNERARRRGEEELPDVPLMRVIGIDNLRDDLEEARTQGVEALSAAELKAAARIKHVIAGLFVGAEYKDDGSLPTFTPASTLKDHKIECTVATTIGNRALKALGIRHAAVITPKHIATLLATSDGKAYLDDFYNNPEKDAIPLKDTDLIDRTGTPIAINEVAGFADAPTKKGFVVDDLSGNLKEQVGLNKNEPIRVLITDPERGVMSSLFHNLSLRYNHLGDKDEAVAAAKSSLSANSIMVGDHANLGYFYRNKGEYEAAVSAYLEAAALTPNDPNIQWDLALAYNDLGYSQNDPAAAQKSYIAALRHIDNVTGLKSRDAEYWHVRAEINGQLGNYDAAIVCAETAIALDPDEVSHRNRHIGLHYQSERYDDTLRLVDEAFATVDPADTHTIAFLHNVRGITFSEMGRHEEALAEVLQACELNPEEIGFVRNKGRRYADVNRLDEAVGVFTTLLDSDPADILSHYELAKLYFKQEKFTEAKKHLALSAGIEKHAKTDKNKADLAEIKRKITEAPVTTS